MKSKSSSRLDWSRKMQQRLTSWISPKTYRKMNVSDHLPARSCRVTQRSQFVHISDNISEPLAYVAGVITNRLRADLAAVLTYPLFLKLGTIL